MRGIKMWCKHIEKRAQCGTVSAENHRLKKIDEQFSFSFWMLLLYLSPSLLAQSNIHRQHSFL